MVIIWSASDYNPTKTVMTLKTSIHQIHKNRTTLSSVTSTNCSSLIAGALSEIVLVHNVEGVCIGRTDGCERYLQIWRGNLKVLLSSVKAYFFEVPSRHLRRESVFIFTVMCSWLCFLKIKFLWPVYNLWYIKSKKCALLLRLNI
jgi:hypothetical protein